ncbi:PKD domain-containing protein [Mucilaginibacter sp.]
MYRIKLFGVLTLAILLVNCRKSLEVAATDANTDFYLSGPNIYLNSEMLATASSNAGTAYDWDFGDGTAHGTGVIARHTYSRSCIFTVTLKVGSNSSFKRIRVFPGELSYQVKNSIDRDFSNYQCRILDPSGGNVYTLNGNLITSGSVTDTIFVTIGSNRVATGLLADGYIQSNKGSTLKFGIGIPFDKGKHNYIEMTPATLGNFYQTSGNTPLPSSAITIASAIANY